jgi:hypothetical protein
MELGADSLILSSLTLRLKERFGHDVFLPTWGPWPPSRRTSPISLGLQRARHCRWLSNTILHLPRGRKYTSSSHCQAHSSAPIVNVQGAHSREPSRAARCSRIGAYPPVSLPP